MSALPASASSFRQTATMRGDDADQLKNMTSWSKLRAERDWMQSRRQHAGHLRFRLGPLPQEIHLKDVGNFRIHQRLADRLQTRLPDRRRLRAPGTVARREANLIVSFFFPRVLDFASRSADLITLSSTQVFLGRQAYLLDMPMIRYRSIRRVRQVAA